MAEAAAAAAAPVVVDEAARTHAEELKGQGNEHLKGEGARPACMWVRCACACVCVCVRA